MSEQERPWVKLPANQVPRGVRLWDHQGEPYAKFVRVAYTPSSDMTRNGKWSMVFFSGLSGLEFSTRLDSPTVPIKILREDVTLQTSE